ncbi:MAG: sugar ABC transporter substrate-binding protein [Anaerolineales bacterium]|nr:sugar ABC transporter substrate-binding protein [Anaerolineales bacterium]
MYNSSIHSTRLSRITWFLIIALLLLAIVGCSSSENTVESAPQVENTPQVESTPQVENTPQTVVFMISGSLEEQAAYETLIASFEEDNPNIDVVLNNFPEEGFNEKLATMFSASAPPDIFLMNFRHLGVFTADSALYSLDSLLDSSQALTRDDFYPAALKAFTYNGMLQCLPQNLSSPVIYYNKALFDAAGLAYPDGSWNWDDFVATARALTLDTDGDGTIDQYGFGTSIQAMRLAPFIWQNGADFMDDYNNPTRLTLDTPEAREAIEWFANLQVVEHVMPDAVAEDGIDSKNRFLQGTMGMYMNSRVQVPTFRTITDFEWDAASLPVGKQPASVLHSDGFCVPVQVAEDANHLQVIWSFIEYAFSETGQALLAETGRTVPSRIKVAESEAFLSSVPPQNNQAWLDAAPYLNAFPILPEWSAIESIITNELKRAVYGQATVDEAIQSMQDNAADVLAP